MTQNKKQTGWEGVFDEEQIPLPMRRVGISAWRDDHIKLLDRRRLPLQEEYLKLYSTEEVANAIENMSIQGAFSISICAGYGLALATPDRPVHDLAEVESASARLIKTRPTGLAIKRMMAACLNAVKKSSIEATSARQAVLKTVEKAATALAKQGYETGKNACDLLQDNATILTHCFPDRSYVYLLLETQKRGKTINIIASETRPYLQGARLTALCAQQTGFDVQVITDGMGGFLMQQGRIDTFLTAADRVCMDGTVCNKVGTYQYALAANANNIPYYTLRQSGPDLESLNQHDIEMEYRSGDEVIYIAGERVAPFDVNGLYPAFDITPPNLVSKIITDRGIFNSHDIAQYLTTPEVITGSVV